MTPEISEEIMEFKVRDIVEFGGARGVVVDSCYAGNPWSSVCVIFEDKSLEDEYFCKDGRYISSHSKPLLVLIDRPKKKVKKYVEGWANMFPDGRFNYYMTKEQAELAKSYSSKETITIKLTGEYEAEE